MQLLPIPAFDDNYIWCLYDEQSRQALVVDPGDAEPVLATLSEMHLQLTAIVITHHHFDHVGGLDGLLSKYTVPVYGPINPKISQISHRLKQGDVMSVLGVAFKVLEIPGHTLDHIAFFAENCNNEPLLFCGDTLFAGGCGRVFEGDAPMMLDSLTKLAELPANTKVCCAHEYTLANLAFASEVEPDNQELQQRRKRDQRSRDNLKPTLPSTVALELLTNPFLRCRQPAVIAAATAQENLTQQDAVSVFAAIRSWKDVF